MTQPLFKSKRLFFYPFTAEDYQLLFDLETNLNARKYFGDICQAETIKNMLTYFINCFKQHGYSYFKVYLKNTQEFIGAAGFDHHQITNEVGLGYIFYEEFWQNNYPFETIQELLLWGKENINSNHFIAVVHPDDIYANEAMQRNNMTFDKQEIFLNMPCNYYKIYKDN